MGDTYAKFKGVTHGVKISVDAEVSGDAETFDRAVVAARARVSGRVRVGDNAWVTGHAQVSGDAQVYGDAWVTGHAQVYGHSQVYGDAWVDEDAQVYGDAQVCGDAEVYGEARVYGGARLTTGYVAGQADISSPGHVHTHTGEDGAVWTVARSRVPAGFEVWEGDEPAAGPFPDEVEQATARVCRG